MATSTLLRTAGLALPSARTQAVRNISMAWSVRDVADALPAHLHPQGEHCADSWSLEFLTILADIAGITHQHELEKIRQKLQAAVDIRRNRHPNRATYLIVKDLKSTRRVFGHKRAAERTQAERQTQSAIVHRLCQAQ